MAACVLPIAPIHSRWWNYAVAINGDLPEEIGWPELVQTIAAVRDKVPQAERQHLAILAGNYGEAGAVNLYGPQYDLPSAISGTNSFWWRGYGDSPPETVIEAKLSLGRKELSAGGCRLGRYEYERDHARFRALVDPVVNRPALHQNVAGFEVHDRAIEIHVDLA